MSVGVGLNLIFSLGGSTSLPSAFYTRKQDASWFSQARVSFRKVVSFPLRGLCMCFVKCVAKYFLAFLPNVNTVSSVTFRIR